MSLEAKKRLLIVLSLLFVASLIFVQWMEVVRRAEEAGLTRHRIAVPATSKECASCHMQSNPGIVEQWKGSPTGSPTTASASRPS